MHKGLEFKFDSLRVDGGMAHNQWFIQQLSAVIQKTIFIPNILENTAKGAAMVVYAACHDGVDLQTVSQSWQNYQLVNPIHHDDFDAYHNWTQAIYHLKNK